MLHDHAPHQWCAIQALSSSLNLSFRKFARFSQTKQEFFVYQRPPPPPPEELPPPKPPLLPELEDRMGKICLRSSRYSQFPHSVKTISDPLVPIVGSSSLLRLRVSLRLPQLGQTLNRALRSDNFWRKYRRTPQIAKTIKGISSRSNLLFSGCQPSAVREIVSVTPSLTPLL